MTFLTFIKLIRYLRCFNWKWSVNLNLFKSEVRAAQFSSTTPQAINDHIDKVRKQSIVVVVVIVVAFPLFRPISKHDSDG